MKPNAFSEATFKTFTHSFVTDRQEGPLSSCARSLSLSNRGQCHHIYFYLLVVVVVVGGSTYVLKCSVDCLCDALNVVVAVFLRILWKEQLTNFLIARVISIIPAAERLRN